MSELLADLFSIESDFTPDLEKQVRGLRMLITDPSGSSGVFVAVIDKRIIGMATVQTLISTAEGGRVGLVEDVIVHRLFRRAGAGSLLIDRIIAWGRGKGLKRLQLLADQGNHQALNFYSSRGWTTTRLICLRNNL